MWSIETIALIELNGMESKMGFIRYYRSTEEKGYFLKYCKGQSHAFRKHTHEEYSIALVTGGESLFRFVNEEFNIRKGQLVVIAPGVVHQCIPECVAEWSFYMLHITVPWIQAAGFDVKAIPSFAIRDLQNDEFYPLELYFKQACENIELAEENIVFLAEAAFSQAFVQDVEWLDFDSSEPMLDEICEVIRARFNDNITLEELACMAGMDRYTLIRRFRRRFNTTPHSWQIMLRVNEARRLLEDGMSATDVALEVGFYDQSHFTKMFKETFGVTPMQFLNPEGNGKDTSLSG